MSNARLVLDERNKHSSVKVTLHSVRELEEYIESGMRRSLLGGILTNANAISDTSVDMSSTF
jgi:hypothetical protein